MIGNIVLIVPNFFAVAEEMRSQLVDEGYSVKLIYDRPFTSPIYHALAKYFPSLVEKLTEPYYIKQLDTISTIDSLIVINGQTVSAKIYDRINLKFPYCKKYLYMWDSTENRPTALKYRDFFDDIFSFDPKSCFDFDLKFLPLFFFRKPRKVGSEKSLGNKIIAVTSHHADRHKIIMDIAERHKTKVYMHLFLKSALQYFFLKRVTGELRDAKKEDFKFFPLTTNTIDKLTHADDVILDIHHPAQTGLTLRSIEALGMGMKLATTNSSVSKYKVYNEKNIHILDRCNPDIPECFINRKADTKHNTKSADQLEFKVWIRVILGELPYDVSNYTDFDLNCLFK